MTLTYSLIIIYSTDISNFTFKYFFQSYSVRREVYGHKDGKSVYFTLAFAGMTLMAAIVVAVAVTKRRAARSPHSQGFIEVDQAATPEERHVANMQINGYENPTYKYFEVKE